MKTSLITAAALLLAALGLHPSDALAATATHDRGTWTAATSMLAPVTGHIAVSLHDGRVLVIGGEPDMEETPVPWVQLYDPVARAWSFTGAMHTGRVGETATVLQDGRVLVVGGIGPTLDDLPSAEIFDPRRGSWQVAASLPQTRFSQSASLLPDGRVLVVGGIVDRHIARSTLLYDSLHDRWESGAPTHFLHAQQASVTLLDGRILIAGGYGGRSEIYNPHAADWSVAGNAAQARRPVMVAMPDGSVLLASGISSTYRDLRSAVLYEPARDAWTKVGPLRTPRDAAAAVALLDGRALVVGGEQARGRALRSAEIYDPASRSWSTTAPMRTARSGPTATLLADGTVLVCGGANLDGVVATCERYHPVLEAGRQSTRGTLAAPFHIGHRASSLRASS